MVPADPNDMFPHDREDNNSNEQSNQAPVQKSPRPVNPRNNIPGGVRKNKPPSKRSQFGLLIVGITFIIIFILILVLAAASASSGGSFLQNIFNIQGDLRGILRTIVNAIFGLLAAISLIALIIGGFIYMVSTGDKKEVTKARRILIISGISLIIFSILWVIMAVMITVPPQETQEVEEAKILTQPDPPQGSAPFTVVFDVQGYPEENYFFSWDFGDGKSSTGKSLSHTYTREGFFETKVQIIHGETQETTMLEKQIMVENTSPIATIVADPIKGRAPLEVLFDASDSKDPNGNIVEYAWDFGDNSVTTEKNQAFGQKISHEYTKDGSYTVTLTVTDNNGETQTASQTIEVGEEPDIPTAVITTTPPAETSDEGRPTVTGVVPFKVSFSGSKSRDKDGEIVSYVWDFGDGSAPADSQTATHTFEEIGTYTVQLTVTDNDSKKDSSSVNVLVKEPAKAPTAVIKSQPPHNASGEISGQAPFTVELDGGNSIDEDGNIVLYEWNLGDNSPIQTGQSISHTYENEGTYTVTLTVRDNDQQVSLPAEITLKIGQTPLQAPVADFTTDPDPATGYVPFSVTFDGSASYDSDGSIISYEWDFGDSMAILSGAQVAHEYYDPGIYTVTLVVHDDDGLTDSTIRQVAVQLPAPEANISASRDSGNAPLTITFDASDSSGNITKYDWDFDDGTKESGRKVTHTFEEAGEYEVELKVSDSQQQISREYITITVD